MILKVRLLFLTISLCISCTNKRDVFEKIACSDSETSANSNLRKIFKPCREYIYRAKYWDKNYNLISDERIWMMATGKDWAYEPESQDEIALQYEVDETKRDQIQKYSINPEFDQPWRQGEVTGVIETEDRVWMHPFRSNQYIFTEVAAFPNVLLPLEKGTQWTSGLNIYEGWGRWSNSTLENVYRVLGVEMVETEFAILESWHIKATSSAHFGTSVHDFWYHEEYGFVKMIIRNYAGQLLTFELIEVK